MTINAFPLIEIAVREMIEARYPAAVGKTGGDLSYDGEDLYVWVSLIPGSGAADQTSGQWSLDIDVFGKNYIETMNHALVIEAGLLTGMFQGSQMNVDTVSGGGPAEVPWDDETVYRISAVYTFTARRSG